MKKQFTAKDLHETKDGKKHDVTIEYDMPAEKEEANNKILEILDSDNPLKLIKEARKLGINGIKGFVKVFFLFISVNIVLASYTMSKLFTVGIDQFSTALFILLICAGFTIYAVYRAYHYLIFDAVRVIYENTDSLFRKIAATIVDQAEGVLKGAVEVTDRQVSGVLDFGKIVNDKFQKLPSFLRKGITFFLKKIPFSGMLIKLKQDIVDGHKEKASNELFSLMDNFIKEFLFGMINLKWVWWILPVNIIVVLLIIQLKMG